MALGIDVDAACAAQKERRCRHSSERRMHPECFRVLRRGLRRLLGAAVLNFEFPVQFISDVLEDFTQETYSAVGTRISTHS